jgi:3-hydroxyacyl-CoA dehydrogenase
MVRAGKLGVKSGEGFMIIAKAKKAEKISNIYLV